MAKYIVDSNIAGAWQQLVRALLTEGHTVAPRGQQTIEITNVTLEINRGLDNILVNATRDLNYRFMIAEWLWIQAGLNDVASLSQYNSIMKNFSDDGAILSGAYGPRLAFQWEYIAKSLEDRETRQAVATIWTPNPQGSRDIPCTISLQWLIRDDLLHCTVNMRSSDAWLGLPYDFFTFSQLTNMVSSFVDVPVGSITMNLASSHLYAVNTEKATRALFDMNYEAISSPPLGTAIPTRLEIIDILNRKFVPGLDNTWFSYASALTKNSANALDILRGLDPIYGK